jgi:hypothetical protein
MCTFLVMNWSKVHKISGHYIQVIIFIQFAPRSIHTLPTLAAAIRRPALQKSYIIKVLSYITKHSKQAYNIHTNIQCIQTFNAYKHSMRTLYVHCTHLYISKRTSTVRPINTLRALRHLACNLLQVLQSHLVSLYRLLRTLEFFLQNFDLVKMMFTKVFQLIGRQISEVDFFQRLFTLTESSTRFAYRAATFN